MKIICTTKDETAVAMMQNLCSMLSGEMTSISMMMNGIKMIECNMMMTWTSEDNMMCKIIQKCCNVYEQCSRLLLLLIIT
ncbi:hypothetical protein [Clostridium tyrobutyricum]|uniref:hypothetical protein n=1 Tax=Clostridium tyrobutyricum TaxID=1519 RepID=UPI001FA705C9|nr:hypothetical protein [Clostridium tyrobutyricum]